MNATAGEFQHLRESVGRLRRQNRWLAGLTALIGLALVLSIVSPVQTLRAARFHLDDNGQQRGMWRTLDQEPALILQDRAGVWRAMMNVAIEGPTIRLNQGDGDSSVILSSAPEGALILLHDERGRPRIRLIVEGNEPRLDFLDEEGILVTSFP